MKYLEVELALRLQSQENIPFRNALNMAKEAKHPGDSTVKHIETPNVTEQESTIDITDKSTWPPLPAKASRKPSYRQSVSQTASTHTTSTLRTEIKKM
jgi:hypothetical protein